MRVILNDDAIVPLLARIGAQVLLLDAGQFARGVLYGVPCVQPRTATTPEERSCRSLWLMSSGEKRKSLSP